jgi:probable F420-dependent oxidoreductase
MGVDSLWTWDHFFPLRGDPDAAHFEAWTLLTALAVETSRVQLGLLVGCARFRNPHLVADMARTVDHLSHGRLVLGLGACSSQRDHDEYEVDFGTPSSRVRDLDVYLGRVRSRLERLNPPPVGPLPLLVGGDAQSTLGVVARHADVWSGTGTPSEFERRSQLLDVMCEGIGRDPSEIERTAHLSVDNVDWVEAFIDAGARHVILTCPPPFDLTPVERVLRMVGGGGG